MDVNDAWGPFTPYCPPRPAVDWVAMITELDSLIDRYCTAAKLSEEAKARILVARFSQPLVSIPESFAWFREQMAAIDTPGAGLSERGSDGRQDRTRAHLFALSNQKNGFFEKGL